MNKKSKTLILVCLMALSFTSLAKSIEGMSFQHKDWEIACDNTGTCRAAGYHSTVGWVDRFL